MRAQHPPLQQIEEDSRDIALSNDLLRKGNERMRRYNGIDGEVNNKEGRFSGHDEMHKKKIQSSTLNEQLIE